MQPPSVKIQAKDLPLIDNQFFPEAIAFNQRAVSRKTYLRGKRLPLTCALTDMAKGRGLQGSSRSVLRRSRQKGKDWLVKVSSFIFIKP